MNNEPDNKKEITDDGPVYDKYLPGPIQVLVEWILLLLDTLFTFFKRKEQ